MITGTVASGTVASITAAPSSIVLFAGDASATRPVRIGSARDCATGPLAKSIELFYANGGGAAYVAADFHALDELPEVALLVMPGVTNPQVINQALALCARTDRCFLIADRPSGPIEQSSYGAIYAPALLVNGSVVPASGAVAGVYARMDATRGVWRAPAGTEAWISGIDGPAEVLGQSDELNVIRVFPGGIGTVVWGARTIARDDPEWRYVPVRRLALMISESIRAGLQPFVFEPNDASTWSLVAQTISNFLFGLWKQGALAGSKPEDGFSVQIGAGSTMTEQDIAEGNLRVTVLFAPVHPAEFVVLDFTLAMRA